MMPISPIYYCTTAYNVYHKHLKRGDELLEHLARSLLNLQRDLHSSVHEVRDLAELFLLHSAGGESRGAHSDTSRTNGRTVPLLPLRCTRFMELEFYSNIKLLESTSTLGTQHILAAKECVAYQLIGLKLVTPLPITQLFSCRVDSPVRRSC